MPARGWGLHSLSLRNHRTTLVVDSSWNSVAAFCDGRCASVALPRGPKKHGRSVEKTATRSLLAFFRTQK